MNKRELLKQIGQVFVLSYKGAEPPRSFLNILEEEGIGGVILFADNCPSHEATKQAVATLRSTCATVPFIAVDQEGGRVSRITGAPAEFHSAWDYVSRLGLEKFIEDYRRAAVFMETIGLNLNLAPVCDLCINPNNRCLEGRCFGATAEQANPFIEAMVEISRASGLLSCLKHFPGLGAVEIDPHQATSVADFDENIWVNRERVTFQAGIDAGADMIMTTHLLAPAFDTKIVTGSDRFIRYFIRQRLGFDGPVITDDLTMKGAAALGGIGERTIAAFNAGHDLLLFGQDTEAAIEAFEEFRNAVSCDEIDPSRLESALNRVAGLKYRLRPGVIL